MFYFIGVSLNNLISYDRPKEIKLIKKNNGRVSTGADEQACGIPENQEITIQRNKNMIQKAITRVTTGIAQPAFLMPPASPLS
jgi:hypothetical protein